MIYPSKSTRVIWQCNDNYIDPDGVRAIHFAPLFLKYPDVKFVLMHTSLSLDRRNPDAGKTLPQCLYRYVLVMEYQTPYDMIQFIRQALHSVPLNKIFLFGGDTPMGIGDGRVCYSGTERRFYTALSQEISDGFITEQEADSHRWTIYGSESTAPASIYQNIHDY